MPHNLSGWTRQPHDPRDLVYAPPRRLLRAPPPTVDLTPGMGAQLDQGDLGSCGPFTAAELIMFDQRAEGLTVAEPSELFVYYNARVLMGTAGQDSGVDNRSLFKSLSQTGFCPAPLWPYVTARFASKPPAAAYQAALPNRVTEYAAVPQVPAQMQAALAAGRPFCFGFDCYGQIMGDAAAETGVLTDPAGTPVGGHDVSVVGFNATGRDLPGELPHNRWPAGHYKFRNHWTGAAGRPWGDCLLGDTTIRLLDGTCRPIKELADEGKEVWVYSYDTKRGRIVPAPAMPVASGVRKDFVRVTLDNGEQIVCTRDHKWLLRNGKYRKAAGLVPGDSLMPLYTKDDRGYERFYAPHNHRWITTHWSVAHDQDLRDEHGHTSDCSNPKCRLVVHHDNLNSLDNRPDNLKVLYECRHRQKHRTLSDSFDRAQKMRERWAADDGTMRKHSLENLAEYARRLRSGEVGLSETRLAAMRETVKLATAAAARKVAEEGITELQRQARVANATKLGRSPKTESHRRHLSDAIRAAYAEGWCPLTEAQLVARRKNIKAALAAPRKPATEQQIEARRENMRRLNASGRAYRNHRVMKVEQFDLLMPVYDLKVNRKHCRNFALGAGVFVHNSGFGYVSFVYAHGPHASDFWVISTVPGGVTPPPPPTPTPTPAPAPLPARTVSGGWRSDDVQFSFVLSFPEGSKSSASIPQMTVSRTK